MGIDNEGETVELQVTVSDFEDATSTIPVNVTSSEDGILGAVTLDEQGQGSLAVFSATTPWCCNDSVGQTGVPIPSSNAPPSSPIVLCSQSSLYRR